MSQFAIAADGARIAYETAGEGAPVLLVHGFASNRIQNWRSPGWYDALTAAGFGVIAMDCRGHGESDKFYEPERYGHDVMANDILSVLRTVGAGPVHLMGYSMGGFIGVHILMKHPELIGKFVIGGVGQNYFSEAGYSRQGIADALLAPDRKALTDPTQRAFRAFAEQPGKDIRALAACMRANRKTFSANELGRSTRPVLVVCGENDTLAGPPYDLASAFRDGHAFAVPRRDHMTTVGDKVYKEAALAFLRY